eukprot:TRINITY_DN538_c0_g3_i1.p1 TRINITY_DN538_c0_g3~~TRINITY_DN538_c0_g3_i1.p1  ORF type:complete len:618 (+),score=193.40 TRINITY_DN538_c0_g3_i1:29-1882(+)
MQYGGKKKGSSTKDGQVKPTGQDSKSKLPVKKKKELPPAPAGVQVWVGNLPKKRNVERDLQAQLRNVAGLLHVRPVTSGSGKTREPTCVGFAFLTFSNERQATRFVTAYQGKTLPFGKVEKKLVCQLASSHSSPSDENTASPSRSVDAADRSADYVGVKADDMEELRRQYSRLTSAAATELAGAGSSVARLRVREKVVDTDLESMLARGQEANRERLRRLREANPGDEGVGLRVEATARERRRVDGKGVGEAGEEEDERDDEWEEYEEGEGEEEWEEDEERNKEAVGQVRGNGPNEEEEEDEEEEWDEVEEGEEEWVEQTDDEAPHGPHVVSKGAVGVEHSAEGRAPVGRKEVEKEGVEQRVVGGAAEVRGAGVHRADDGVDLANRERGGLHTRQTSEREGSAPLMNEQLLPQRSAEASSEIESKLLSFSGSVGLGSSRSAEQRRELDPSVSLRERMLALAERVKSRAAETDEPAAANPADQDDDEARINALEARVFASMKTKKFVDNDDEDDDDDEDEDETDDISMPRVMGTGASKPSSVTEAGKGIGALAGASAGGQRGEDRGLAEDSRPHSGASRVPLAKEGTADTSPRKKFKSKLIPISMQQVLSKYKSTSRR